MYNKYKQAITTRYGIYGKVNPCSLASDSLEQFVTSLVRLCGHLSS